MLRDLGGWHIIAIVVVIVLLFGATKLPIFAKGLGQSVRIFRKEMHDVKTDIEDERSKTAKQQEDAVPVYTNEPPANQPTAGGVPVNTTATPAPGTGPADR